MRSVVCAAVLAALTGCSGAASGFCGANGDCERSLLGVSVNLDAVGSANDSVGVCTENQKGTLSALRANDEDSCQKAADAYELFMGCVADKFNADSDGCKAIDDCDSESRAYSDALSEIRGNECQDDET
jgi:hypothetical protein